jgi:hypothetical protein
MSQLNIKSQIRKIISPIRNISRPIVLWIIRLFIEEVLVLGDSHALVFNSKKFKAYFGNHIFNVVIVGGATVSGLKNPNSKTQALPIFRDSIKKSTAARTILLLGEVDTGFVIWYRAEKNKTPIAIMLDRAIENYQRLLIEVSKKSRVICISTPLPTIQDGNDWGEIANARKNVKATQLERTALTIQFNKRIQEFCERNEFTYLSFDNESIGENGLVNPYLLNSDPNNHHYDIDKYADMLINKLKASLEQGASQDGDSATRRCRR